MTVVEGTEASVARIPPFAQLFDFLSPGEHEALLEWILANEARFTPATISVQGGANVHDATVRTALKLRDLGPLDATLRSRLTEVLPELMRRTGAKPPAPSSLELELAAYGEGARFAAHLDMPVGPHRRPLGARSGEDRVISAVYYLHRTPKRFSGGALRLYPFGTERADSGQGLDIEPVDNSLVAFPSWSLHEVRPVTCAVDAFADRRLSLNCWYCRRLSSRDGPE